MITKKCRVCKKSYSTYYESQKYCSNECYHKSGIQKGKIITEDTRRKIRLARAKQIITEEHKKNIGAASRRMWANPEFKYAQSKKRRGKNNGMYGRHHSLETKLLISKINKTHGGISR